MKRTMLATLSGLLLVSSLFAAGQQDAATKGEEGVSGSIMVYVAMRRTVIEILKEGFEAAHPGTTIDVYRSGTGEVLAKIQAEDSAGGIQADVISVAELPIFTKLWKEGKIIAYSPKNLDKVADMFKYENGAYSEVRWSGMAIAWNTQLVKTPPKTWKDLLKPEYEGKICMPDPTYSGTAVATIGTFVTTPGYGWEYFEAFAANGGKVLKSNGEVGQAVSSGEFALGIIVDGNAYNLKMEGSPIDFRYPQEGTVLLPGPMAILSNCKNLPLAKAFLDYVYSDKGMNDMSKFGYVGVVPGTSDVDIDFTNVKLLPTDWDYIDKNRTDMLERFASLFE